ncbi:STAS domain-containing protein [Streptodolium elevatio]
MQTLARDGRHLTVDLTAVTHIAAEGAAVLLVLARKTAGPDGTLTLVGLRDGQPAQRLDGTGLSTLPHVVVG